MEEVPALSRALRPRLCAFVILDLMAMIVVNSFVLVSPCVATEGNALCKVTCQLAVATTVLTVVRVNGAYRSSLDQNVTSA